MSLIARTAGIGRSAPELQWDLNYLLKLWTAIDGASKGGKGAFLIYQESSLVIRAIRDYFTADIGEILIDTDDIFDQAQQFMTHVMPETASKVKRYRDDAALFSRFQIEHQIETAFARTVTLPSGGAIVIDHTEALVSVDVNSARSTRGSDIEETATRTNLEAADEIARQMRLRDLGGLIVVDFIDMDESKNRREVETRLRDALRSDRARVQFSSISKFGLLEMSRQRLRPALSEGSHITCPRCNGTGHIRDTESSALQILRMVQEESMKDNTAAVHVQVPVEVTSFLLNEKRTEITKIELKQRITVLLVPNKALETPNYRLERLRHDDPRLENLQASYSMIDEPEEEVGITRREKAKPRQEPLIKGILPDAPAPQPAAKPVRDDATPVRDAASTPAPATVPVAAPAASAPIEVARQPAPAGRGFFSWVKQIFVAPSDVPTTPARPAAEALAVPAPAAKPAAERTEGERRSRGERGGRGERTGRGGERGERGDRGGDRGGRRSERSADRGGDRPERVADGAPAGEAQSRSRRGGRSERDEARGERSADRSERGDRASAATRGTRRACRSRRADRGPRRRAACRGRPRRTRRPARRQPQATGSPAWRAARSRVGRRDASRGDGLARHVGSRWGPAARAVVRRHRTRRHRRWRPRSGGRSRRAGWRTRRAAAPPWWPWPRSRRRPRRRRRRERRERRQRREPRGRRRERPPVVRPAPGLLRGWRRTDRLVGGRPVAREHPCERCRAAGGGRARGPRRAWRPWPPWWPRARPPRGRRDPHRRRCRGIGIDIGWGVDDSVGTSGTRVRIGTRRKRGGRQRHRPLPLDGSVHRHARAGSVARRGSARPRAACLPPIAAAARCDGPSLASGGDPDHRVRAAARLARRHRRVGRLDLGPFRRRQDRGGSRRDGRRAGSGSGAAYRSPGGAGR
jgi:ribonuclease E